MDRIEPTIMFGARGDRVRNLHEAMRALDQSVDERELLEQTFAESTQAALRNLQERLGLRTTGDVNAATADVINGELTRLGLLDRQQPDPPPGGRPQDIVLAGNVRSAALDPFEGWQLQLVSRSLRIEFTLATASSSSDGQFEFSIEPPPPNARLQVVATDPTGQSTARSAMFLADPGYRIEVEAAAPVTSGYQMLLDSVRPLLSGVGVEDLIEDDVHQDITFLASETGHSEDDLSRLTVAHRVEATFGVPAAAAFAFMSGQLTQNPFNVRLGVADRFSVVDSITNRVGASVMAMSDDAVRKALVDAIAQGVVSEQAIGSVDVAVAAIAERRVQYTLDNPLGTGKSKLREMLTLAGLDDPAQTTFAKAMLSSTSPGGRFWKSLTDNSGLAPEVVAAARDVTEIGSYTKNHIPLITALRTDIANQRFTSIRSLAAMSSDDWVAYIANGPPELIPDNVIAPTLGERQRMLGTEIYERVVRANPSTALLAEAGRRGTTDPETVNRMIAVCETTNRVDLLRTNIDGAIATDPERFGEIPDGERPKVIGELRRHQRAIRIARHPQAAASLLTASLDSAAAITARGRTQFIDFAKTQGMSPFDASKAFRRAELIDAMVIKTLADFSAGAVPAPTNVLPTPMPTPEQQAAIDEHPTLKRLFGSQDFCACEECNSVYSPAAYLADLLLWLRNRAQPGAPVRDALAGLLQRRPDIADIKLSCNNTNIEVPYIDLVNELLEDAVAPRPAAVPPAAARQTSGTSRERRAIPEHTNTAAYDTLAAARYPMQLPFDRSFDEAVVLLDQLGTSYAEIIDMFASVDGDRAAARSFGLDDVTATIIGTADPGAITTMWNAPVVDLTHVPRLLKNASLTYEQLQAIVALDWINGAGPRLSVAGVDDSCDTTNMTVLNLTEERADRIQRFLRMWRHSSWTLAELDALLNAPAFGASNLDVNSVTHLRLARRLQDERRLTVAELTALFGRLPMVALDDGPSLYASTFEALTPNAEPDAALAEDAVVAAGVTATVQDHATAIAAGIGVTVAELARLTVIAALPAPVLVTIDTLTVLWRWARLARVVGCSIDELATWQQLVAADPFAAPHALLDWLRDRDELASLGMSVSDLSGMLAPTALPVADDVVTKTIEEMRSVLGKIPESDGGGAAQRVVQLIPTLDDQASQARASSLLSGVSSTTPADDADFVQQSIVPVLGDAAAALFTVIAPPPAPAVLADTVAQRVTAVSNLLRDIAVRNAVVDVLARATGAGADALRPLMEVVTVSTAGGPVSTLDALTKVAPDRATAEARPEVKIAPTAFAPAYDAIRQLHAVVRFARNLGLSALDLAWLSHQSPTAWMTTANIPMVPGATIARPLFLRTARLFVSLRPLTRSGRSWAEVVDLVQNPSVTEPAFPGELGALVPAVSSVPTARFVDAADALGINRAALAEPDKLLRVCRAVALLDRLGTDATTVTRWATQPANTQVSSMWDAARARYTYDGWLDDLPRFSDPMRERRRDALVAYLVVRPPTPVAWRDANTMFGWFLLDVSMAACLMTSRIVQAYSSVQLYVQRCLMHRELELSGVVADATKDDGWLQWPARSQHPIFAANLQIWHYPENWLNQVDRPGKTEGFLELEREMSGQDATEDAVETALLRYFERLDEVARLRVIGFHDDRTAGIVHVIGRTESAPHHHYYRTQKSGRWSPWTRMDVEIRADTVSMIVFRRRLHVFWVTTSLKAQPMSTKSDNAAPRYGEIELAWTSLRTGKWSPARKAPELLYMTPPLSTLDIGLRIATSGSSLVIDAYSPDHIGQFTYDGRNAYAAQGPVIWNQINALIPGARLGRRVDVTGPVTLPSPANDLAWKSDRLVAVNGVQDLSFTSAPGQFAPTGPLLRSVVGPFSVLGPAQDATFDPACPFFFECQGRTWFVTSRRMYQKGSTFTPEWPSDPLTVPYNIKYVFTRFFYPYADLFFEQLDDGGLDRLYRRALQWDPNSISMSQSPSFKATFQPVSGTVHWGPDVDTLDYAFSDPDFVYNMEPFVHVVDRVAEELVRAGRPEKALRFLAYVLDWTRPSSLTTAGRYWVPRLFAELTDAQVYQERINQLLQAVNSHNPVVEAQVKEWRDNPFQPFRIADMRATAYMKSIAMKTVKALLACGDQLFQSPSRNNLNQAALFYLTAAEVMGDRPQRIAPPQLPALSFNELLTAPGGLDDFANFAADLENAMPLVAADAPTTTPQSPLPGVKTFYFKIPPNPQLLQYWDILADRMFKLRHCQDITGQGLVLPLLDPPVDPGALVRAVAAGVDIAEVISSTNAPLPHERFDVVFARADRVTASVMALGRDLLTAIEKRDAEALAALRATQEVALADVTREIRQLQIDEPTAQVAAARASLDVVESRRAFNAGQPKTYTGDDIALGLSIAAGVLQVIAAIPKLAAGATALVPKIEAGVSGWGAHATVSISGLQLSQATDKFGDVMLLAASLLDRAGAASATMAAHARRYDEHQAAAKQDELDKVQITRSIEAMNLTIAMRTKEQQLFEQQAAQAVAIDEYLRGKFSVTALYDHAIDQLSALYFQSYQTAVALARRAEVCFRHELCVADSAIVQFGHWDSLRKGLLAGERLGADLRRLEDAYHDRNTRRLELVKTVSLLQHDPHALLQLKTTGTASFDLREIDLDADHPGHYQRRIKTVSVTIPCVVGPYSGVHSTLLLTRSSTRMVDVAAPGKYARDDSAGADIRFLDEMPAVRMIETSTAVNDSGLFEINLRDERYLPFEGAGVISSWQIELHQASNDFDVTTVSDVLLEIRYTALPGSQLMRDEARGLVETDRPIHAVRLFNVRRDFGGAWEQLFAAGDAPQKLVLDVGRRHVPFFLRERTVQVSYELVIVGDTDLTSTADAPLDTAAQPAGPTPGIAGARHLAYPTAVPLGPAALTFTKNGGGRLARTNITDVYVFTTFKAQP